MKGLLFAASGFLVGVVFIWNIFLGSGYLWPIGDIALRSAIGDQLLVIDGNTGGVTRIHGPDPWSLLGRSIAHRARNERS